MKSKVKEWIYINDHKDTIRYVLGEKSTHMVACVGINPSTARPDALDNTLKSVKRISEFNGFDGWLMYNVYPQRATDPNDMDIFVNQATVDKNIEVLIKSISDHNIKTIWVAYGDLIESRSYLPTCMSEFYHKLCHLELEWKIIGTPTKKGHPRHPLYKATKSPFYDFDMDTYVTEVLDPLIDK